MIIGKIHPGSGLGDQLFTYITTRTIALDRGFDFGFVGKEFFKGKDFMNLDWGIGTDLKYYIEQPTGKLQITNDDPQPRYWWNKLWEAPAYYDPEVNFIEDGTVIDATCAQDERYWGHRLSEIREWLKVEPMKWIDKSNGENVCILNIRGGEYKTVSELFLSKDYWDKAIGLMWEKHPGIEFEIHTDDLELTQDWFPQYVSIKDISSNWRSVRYAKHLILSNSAFGILPALLNENVKEVIAPRYHARRNIKQWSMPSNWYSKFTYI